MDFYHCLKLAAPNNRLIYINADTASEKQG